MAGSGSAVVAVMESAEHGRREEAAVARDLSGLGHVAGEREVRAALVVLGDVLAEDSQQVPLTEVGTAGFTQRRRRSPRSKIGGSAGRGFQA